MRNGSWSDWSPTRPSTRSGRDPVRVSSGTIRAEGSREDSRSGRNPAGVARRVLRVTQPGDRPLPPPNPDGEGSLTNAFPVDAALGLADYYEVVGFSDPHTSAGVWYGLLNCGLKVSAAGGTDAMANYTSLRGPVGINRTYVQVPDLSDDPATRQRRLHFASGVNAFCRGLRHDTHSAEPLCQPVG